MPAPSSSSAWSASAAGTTTTSSSAGSSFSEEDDMTRSAAALVTTTDVPFAAAKRASSSDAVAFSFSKTAWAKRTQGVVQSGRTVVVCSRTNGPWGRDQPAVTTTERRSVARRRSSASRVARVHVSQLSQITASSRAHAPQCRASATMTSAPPLRATTRRASISTPRQRSKAPVASAAARLRPRPQPTSTKMRFPKLATNPANRPQPISPYTLSPASVVANAPSYAHGSSHAPSASSS
mmetsp:Transcript_254/g.749  ORF Transcript_254/g.749 Transcript_254/m.749 type:complete len:238 (+) Transcript_254:931-1644(+)